MTFHQINNYLDIKYWFWVENGLKSSITIHKTIILATRRTVQQNCSCSSIQMLNGTSWIWIEQGIMSLRCYMRSNKCQLQMPEVVCYTALVLTSVIIRKQESFNVVTDQSEWSIPKNLFNKHLAVDYSTYTMVTCQHGKLHWCLQKFKHQHYRLRSKV